MLLVTPVLVLWAILCMSFIFCFCFFHSEHCFSWYWNHHFCATETFFHWRGPCAGQIIGRMVLCSFPCFTHVTLFFSVFVFVCLCSFPQQSMSWLCCCRFNMESKDSKSYFLSQSRLSWSLLKAIHCWELALFSKIQFCSMVCICLERSWFYNQFSDQTSNHFCFTWYHNSLIHPSLLNVVVKTLNLEILGCPLTGLRQTTLL